MLSETRTKLESNLLFEYCDTKYRTFALNSVLLLHSRSKFVFMKLRCSFGKTDREFSSNCASAELCGTGHWE